VITAHSRAPRRAGRMQVPLRVVIVMGVVLAIGCTRAAGDGSIAAIDVGLVGLGLICAILPDTHVGLVIVGSIGINWVAAVDNPATPWAIGVAVAIAMFHAATAAASVAPLGASWTAAMARRWSRRFAVVAAVSVPVWGATAVLDRADVGRSPALVTAALLSLAASALWIRHETVKPDHRV
jgi:hypothetical protein